MECVSTVYVINKNNQFLMMYNKKQKAWLPPGGFVIDNECIHECAIRETKEEIGLSVGGSLKFMGHVAFESKELDYRTQISPTPIFVAKQTLTNGKVVENFIYLAITDSEIIEVQEYNATWYDYSDMKNIETFDNVRMQIDYIYKNIKDFSFFPEEQVSQPQCHK